MKQETVLSKGSLPDLASWEHVKRLLFATWSEKNNYLKMVDEQFILTRDFHHIGACSIFIASAAQPIPPP